MTQCKKTPLPHSREAAFFLLEATLVDLTNFRSVEGIVQLTLFAGDPSPFS
jgi:hypothetical protein